MNSAVLPIKCTTVTQSKPLGCYGNAVNASNLQSESLRCGNARTLWFAFQKCCVVLCFWLRFYGFRMTLSWKTDRWFVVLKPATSWSSTWVTKCFWAKVSAGKVANLVIFMLAHSLLSDSFEFKPVGRLDFSPGKKGFASANNGPGHFLLQ